MAKQAELIESETLPALREVSMFERLASDPNVDVTKLERLIEMQKDVMAHQAKAAFDAAYVQMRPEIPTIIERAKTDKTTYAPLEDIIEVVTPIISRFGFSLAFKTEWPTEKTPLIIGILTHAQGHARQSEFLSPADKTGSKNDIQALASTVTYGKRYVTSDLLCIVTRKEDDDGERAGRTKPEVKAPDGYDQWLTALMVVAEDGWASFTQAWNKSKPEYRTHLTTTAPKLHASLKDKATKAKPKVDAK